MVLSTEKQQRVAVGRGACRPLRADDPAGAGDVLDDDALAEALADLGHDDARHASTLPPAA